MARSASNGASTAAGRRRASSRGRARAAAHPPGPKARAAKRPAARPSRSKTATRRPRKRAASPRARRRAPRKPARRAALPRLARPPRLALLAAVLLALGAGYFLWFRDSALVAVDDVEVVGVKSANGEEIAAELTRVAQGMTTLHADVDRIEAAARAFPTIEAVDVEMGFPDSARIVVSEHEPTAVVGFGDQRVAVGPDGTLLRGVPLPDQELPQIDAAAPGGAERLADEALEEAIVLGAAPAELRPLIERIGLERGSGVEITLRGGIPVKFGDSGDAEAKWRVAAAVLADPKLDALCSLDVRVPRRPAAGCAATAVEGGSAPLGP